MFKIYDGRSHFYQWDIDRKLIVEDASISEVHFCNQTDNYSLVCKTYIEDGLNLVNVPNILLQNDWRINVYAYDSNYTKFSEQFDVIRRCKPEDYVYTETEILNYNTLSDRITKIEEGGGITPTIGDNGNWYLGSTDTGKPSRGEKGEKGDTGDTGAAGATGATGANGKSAYSYAQDGGYTGTEAEFAAKLAAEGLDKALFVVNITTTDGKTYSADKTFDEIVQAYNEGKYNIVAHSEEAYSVFTIPFNCRTNDAVIFGGILVEVIFVAIVIAANNEIQVVSLPLATTNSKLPNPYPLRFTGAVNETYDGSSAKTIEIPSGGGGGLGNFELIGTVDFSQEGMAAASAGVNFEVSDVSEIVLVYNDLVNSTSSNSSVNVLFNISNEQIESRLRPDSGKSGTPLNGWVFIKPLPGVGLAGIQSSSNISATNYTVSNAKTPYNIIPLASDFRITEIYIQNPPTQYYAVGGTVKVYVR